MEYISTRGHGTETGSASRFTDILLGGLMPDGGLAMPTAYPRLAASDLAAMRRMNYRELALSLLSLFADDIPLADLKSIIDRTYTADIYRNARADENPQDITPVRTLEPGLHLLALSNGPTLAFKDIAMQLLGNLFEYVLTRENRSLNILGATSGDTGSSAEYAMRGKRGIRVFMLSPLGKMSAFQTAQMFSLQDPNIHNLAVRGVFDDCQDIVKAVSNDHAFKARYRIGTVNSINWARVSAQIVYYFKAYFAVTQRDDEQVSFSVPSGNFGNICAGHIARMMGLPIRKLILATNENDVLDEFFRSGVYRPRATAETRQTSSPSMDISKASNFERFVFDLVGRDVGQGARTLGIGRSWRRIRSLRHAVVFQDRRLRFRLRAQHPRRPAGDHSRGVRSARPDGRHPHRRRHQGRAGAPRGGRSAGVSGNRVAGQVRRDHTRSARPRAAAPARASRTSRPCRSVRK